MKAINNLICCIDAAKINPNKFFEINIGSLNFKIYYYAICIVFGMIIAALCTLPIFKKRKIKSDYLIDMLLAVIPCAIVGARLWYVILDLDEFHSFWEIFYTRGGGLAIQGGIFGGAIGIVIISKIHKMKISEYFDICASVLPLGQAIGRWGNFFNDEVYGQVTTNTTFPFNVYINDVGEYHVGLFFYEMMFNLLLFAIIYFFMLKYKGKRGFYATGLYLLGYGTIRASLEPLRMAEFQMGNFGIPASVLTSIAFIIVGLVIIVWLLVLDVREKNYWWKDFFKKNLNEQKLEVVASGIDNSYNNVVSIENAENSNNTNTKLESVEVLEDNKDKTVSEQEPPKGES